MMRWNWLLWVCVRGEEGVLREGSGGVDKRWHAWRHMCSVA